MAHQELQRLWDVHRSAGWPLGVGANEGELMTLDTVVCGCVTYILESQDGLDPRRVDILKDCLKDLDALVPDLGEEALEYFTRVKSLGSLMLETPK